MPPRASLTSSFSVADINNEVVCPLRNQDGSSCRKRCLGEKRYRSMQEHIRRAHPEYYIPKLPATKESFDLMITSPPHERPPPPVSAAAPSSTQHSPHQPQHQQQQQQQHLHRQLQHSDPSALSPAFNLDTGLNSFQQGYANNLGSHDGGYYNTHDTEAAAIFSSMQAQARSSDEFRRGSLIPAASAAQALAQLHYHRGPDSDWGGDNISQNFYADQHNDLKHSIQQHHQHHHHHDPYHVDPTLEESSFMQDPTSFPTSSVAQEQSSLLPSSLARSPSDRPAALPPLQRSLSRQYARPRKSSLSQQARLAKHERRQSKELAKRNSGDKKAFGEGNAATTLLGKRWEDLLDAATSATEEEDSRDLTPIPASPPYQSPQAGSRTSLPPFALGSQFQSFQASPLNRALTPPPADQNLELAPFPSVDSSLSSHQHNDSAGSGSNFHIMNPASMESSPMFSATTTNQSLSQQPVQIYCAGCKKLNGLTESYACTNCICGLCGTCVEALVDNQRNGRLSGCPRCQLNYVHFKPFNLDLR